MCFLFLSMVWDNAWRIEKSPLSVLYTVCICSGWGYWLFAITQFVFLYSLVALHIQGQRCTPTASIYQERVGRRNNADSCVSHPPLNTWRGGINLAQELHAPAPCHNMLLTHRKAIASDCSKTIFYKSPGVWHFICVSNDGQKQWEILGHKFSISHLEAAKCIFFQYGRCTVWYAGEYLWNILCGHSSLYENRKEPFTKFIVWISIKVRFYKNVFTNARNNTIFDILYLSKTVS